MCRTVWLFRAVATPGRGVFLPTRSALGYTATNRTGQRHGPESAFPDRWRSRLLLRCLRLGREVWPPPLRPRDCLGRSSTLEQRARVPTVGCRRGPPARLSSTANQLL